MSVAFWRCAIEPLGSEDSQVQLIDLTVKIQITVGIRMTFVTALGIAGVHCGDGFVGIDNDDG